MKKSLKVLHIIHSLAGGGAEKQLSIICSNSSRYSLNSSIFCVNNNTASDSSSLYLSKSKKKFNLGIFYDLYKAIKDVKPDVIHIWLPASISIPTMLVAKLFGLPVIFSYRSRMFFSRFIVFIEYFVVLLFAKKIISNNKVDQSSAPYRWLYRRKSGQVIYNAVSVNEKKLIDHKESEVFKFVSFGRLTKAKNYPLVIRAMAEFQYDKEWRYDIYGEGEDREKISQLISKFNLQDKIFLHAHTNNIYEIMQKSDRLIFASLWEGMPNVLVEASVFGLPVIVSDIAANKDVLKSVEQNFIWFEPGSAEQLSDALKKSCDHENHKIDAAVIEYIKNRFSVDKLMSSYKLAYQKMVRKTE